MSLEFDNPSNVNQNQNTGSDTEIRHTVDSELALAASALTDILYPVNNIGVFATPSSFKGNRFKNSLNYSYLRATGDQVDPFEIVTARIDHTSYKVRDQMKQEFEILFQTQIDGHFLTRDSSTRYYLGEAAIGNKPFIATANHATAVMVQGFGEHYVTPDESADLLDSLSELQDVIARTPRS